MYLGKVNVIGLPTVPESKTLCGLFDLPIDHSLSILFSSILSSNDLCLMASALN
ncbi:hypothetical protein Solca_1472 [Solitalea canadensis DSM 3403]|uniref:Uncharacterized protein n=1 Tax=Solitalea canadensis (strain ATCC 29591 / DSM 3403 / JCM 21819 / LMG 8368 / NBRC 15130 / NCIMB 12057 / USAM 9D) TaxID=929556 RepID=H8KQD5_SOLCM|nr:hypothetical protein Solca_1472 [Solitalea canadensis DSM 3403]